MKSIKVAWAGCGSFAIVMAHILRSVRGGEITACFDPDEQRSSRFAARFGVPHRAPSFEALLETGASALYLPAPHVFHVPYATRALEAGLHVLCEKPLAFTREEARELVALAVRAGRTLAVNLHNRYYGPAERLVAAVADGAIGRPVFTRVVVPWSRPASYATPGSWHARRDLAGGGTLMTHAIHALDIALRAQQAPVVSGTAHHSRIRFTGNETEDTSAFQLAVADGSVIQGVSTMAAARERRARVEVCGTEGSRAVSIAAGVGFVRACRQSLLGFFTSVRTGVPSVSDASSCVDLTGVVELLYRSADRGEVVHASHSS